MGVKLDEIIKNINKQVKDEIVSKGYNELRVLEEANMGSVDRVAHPFAKIMQEISKELFKDKYNENIMKVGQKGVLYFVTNYYDKDNISISINDKNEQKQNFNSTNYNTENDCIKNSELSFLFQDNKSNNLTHHILSRSQIEINQTEHKLNYIDDNYFKIKNNNTNSNKNNNDNNTNKNIDNNTNIIKEKNTETNNSKINNNPINTEKENEKELTKKDEIENNILDLEGEIEEASIDEENKKINDSKSIMSNYIINPLINPKGDIKSGPQSIFSRTDFNFNIREFKENISNFNEIMSNKGSILPQNNFNYNETEIEIMNENGKDYSSFIETPRASGVYNKRLKYKNSNYNFNMNNTYNFKNMNIKMKKIRDKINQNAKEIQKTNEKINKLDEQIKEYQNKLMHKENIYDCEDLEIYMDIGTYRQLKKSFPLRVRTIWGMKKTNGSVILVTISKRNCSPIGLFSLTRTS